ncbi:MAG: hypothetical protein ACU0BS_05680 [Hasllibacter sp.]
MRLALSAAVLALIAACAPMAGPEVIIDDQPVLAPVPPANTVGS